MDDPLERAFDLIRRETNRLEEPDPVLERRLRERHSAGRATSGRRRRWTLRFAALGLFSSVAYATGGLEWVRSWFFTIEVGHERRAGVVEGDGTRTFRFDTADGGTATVTVRRETKGGEERTEIGLERRSPGREEVDQEVRVLGPSARTFLPDRVLVDATLLFEGRLDGGERVELYALERDGESRAGFAVYLPDLDPERVEWLEQDRFDPLAAGASTHILQRANRLELACDDGRGKAFQLVWLGPSSERGINSSEPMQLETPDGEVRIRVQDPRR